MSRTRHFWLLVVLLSALIAEVVFLTIPTAFTPWCYLIITVGATCLLMSLQCSKKLKLINLGLFCIVGQFLLWSLFGYEMPWFGCHIDMLWFTIPGMYLLFMTCFDENPSPSCRFIKGIMICYMGWFALLIGKFSVWFISLF